MKHPFHWFSGKLWYLQHNCWRYHSLPIRQQFDPCDLEPYLYQTDTKACISNRATPQIRAIHSHRLSTLLPQISHWNGRALMTFSPRARLAFFSAFRISCSSCRACWYSCVALNDVGIISPHIEHGTNAAWKAFTWQRQHRIHINID